MEYSPTLKRKSLLPDFFPRRLPLLPMLTLMFSVFFLSAADNQKSPQESVASLLLKSNYTGAYDLYFKSGGKDSSPDKDSLLKELASMNSLMEAGFKKEAGKEISISIKGISRNIKLTNAKDGKIYFEEKVGRSVVKTAIPFSELDDVEKFRRLENMSEAAKYVIAGIRAFKEQKYAKAVGIFNAKAGPLSEELSAEVKKIAEPITSMMAAIQEGDIEKAKTVIGSGYNLNTPVIFEATMKGKLVPQDYSTTFLLEAVTRQQTEIAKLLVANGADINAKTTLGITPLMMSLMKYRNDTALAKFLLENKADINAKDNSGDTALTGAISLKLFDASKFLIEKGADVNSRNIRGFTPIMLAVLSDNVEIAKLLLDKGADINAKHIEGWTLSDIDHGRRTPEMKAFIEKYVPKKKIKAGPSYNFGNDAKSH